MVLAFSVGCVLPLQAGINNRLARSVSNPVTSAFISFAVGLVALGIYLAVTRQFQLDLAAARQQPAWIWIGGLMGAFYVTSLTILLPRLGATLSFSLIIGGQLLVAMLVDHFGWLNVPVSEISLRKVIGVVFMIVGVVLLRRD